MQGSLNCIFSSNLSLSHIELNCFTIENKYVQVSKLFYFIFIFVKRFREKREGERERKVFLDEDSTRP